MSDVADALAGVPLFALLDEQERGLLAARIERESFAKGAHVFRKGDPGDRIYIVLAGSAEVYVTSDTGDRIVLDKPAEGEFFGEISLLDGGTRTASVLATGDLETLAVDRADLEELFKMRPLAAMDLLTALGRRLRVTNRLLRSTVARNINHEEEDRRTPVMKAADWISEFSGSMPFLFIHCGVFLLWIVLNTGAVARTAFGGFDPFPFGLLTMVVSLEAIILSVFVLLSQNRQASRDRVRNDVEYAVNVRAELEVAHLHEKLDDLHEALSERLARIERNGHSIGK